ncbi:MAG: tetratricopeptide repeat protein [Rhodobacteraceae bacterium]|nr:tetratricopeptide repeat protein [Paracoccaceae bacterium]
MPKFLKHLSLAMALSLATAPMTRAEGFAGAFLAAKSANIANDYVEAAYYYAQAMELAPQNEFIMQGAMFAYIASGDVSAGSEVAERMLEAGFADEYALSVLIVAAFERREYDTVLALLAETTVEINPLISQMVMGWARLGRGDDELAYSTFVDNSTNETIVSFGRYNKAMALAYRKDFAAADALFREGDAYVNRGSLLAHAQVLAELGNRESALSLMVGGPGGQFTDRVSDDLRRRLTDGAPVGFDRVSSPLDGVAETFQVLGDALNADGSTRLALLYARLAQHLQPGNAEALLLIGDILTEQGQIELSLQAYDAVKEEDPLALGAKIGRAFSLRKDDRLDAAITTLRAALEENPRELSLWRSLGDMLRQNLEPEAAREAYSSAIDLLPDPDIPAAWRLYYARAIVAHRADDWPPAEADFRRALRLNPDQPDVLNYLGYSLVERREKLDEALGMIETAVAARPDSGAIADSLGWVYYQLGRFEEAETAMEIAVKLLPVDPILSDHFGDVLWVVDRKREARFQWRRALSYGPEEEDAVRIRDKLARGLDAVLADE